VNLPPALATDVSFLCLWWWLTSFANPGLDLPRPPCCLVFSFPRMGTISAVLRSSAFCLTLVRPPLATPLPPPNRDVCYLSLFIRTLACFIWCCWSPIYLLSTQHFLFPLFVLPVPSLSGCSSEWQVLMLSQLLFWSNFACLLRELHRSPPLHPPQHSPLGPAPSSLHVTSPPFFPL